MHESCKAIAEVRSGLADPPQFFGHLDVVISAMTATKIFWPLGALPDRVRSIADSVPRQGKSQSQIQGRALSARLQCALRV